MGGFRFKSQCGELKKSLPIIKRKGFSDYQVNLFGTAQLPLVLPKRLEVISDFFLRMAGLPQVLPV